MDFVHNFFNQAGKINTLSRDLEFEKRKNSELQSLLEREDFRVRALEKEIVKARNSEIRTLRHHADVMSKQTHTSSFVQLARAEHDAKKPPEVDTVLEEKILWAAKTALQIDKDEGIEPLPLEQYIDIVRQNPEQYIFY